MHGLSTKDLDKAVDNLSSYVIIRDSDYLEHYGTKGQKWGIRKYQNEDGTLTPEGREHYGYNQGWEARQQYKRGEIDRKQLREAKRAKGMLGKIDNVMNLGFGRRIREFENRHKRGIMATTTALNVAGTIAVGVLTGGSVPAIVNVGSKAVGAIIGTKLRLKYVNPAMLKYGYNSSLKEASKELNRG